MCDKYPSIEQFRHFVKELGYIRAATGHTPTHYNLTGTVKLHGTHADIVVHRPVLTTNTDSDEWRYTHQSRNRVLTVQADNMGFAAFVEAIPVEERTELVESIQRTYMATSALASTEPVHTIVMAGEWCGKGVQSGVALDKLPRMFVVYGIKINAVWQPITHYRAVSLEAARVYNILRVPSYHVTVEYDSIIDVMPQLQALTRQVEMECPFSQSFGVSGVGEGIVWVCDELATDSRGWFKVKGDKHSVTHVPTLQDVPEATKARLRNSAHFAHEAATEVRLQQGVEYLREMQRPVTRASTGEYVRWVWQDTLKEEADSIAELGIDVKVLAKAVTKRALEWYQAMLKQPVLVSGDAATESADTVDESDGCF